MHPKSPFHDPVFARLAGMHGYADPGCDWSSFGMGGFDSREHGAPADMPQTQYYPDDAGMGILVIRFERGVSYTNSDAGPTIIVDTDRLPHTAWAAIVGRPVSDVIGHEALHGMAVTGIEHRSGQGFDHTDIAITPTGDAR